MSGENNRRDKALESIARELQASTRLLALIEENTRIFKEAQGESASSGGHEDAFEGPYGVLPRPFS